MRHWILWTTCLLAIALGGNLALAQYRPAPRKDAPAEADSFEDAVDLGRFRKGNIGWDTQELIHSGLTALHAENQQILKELREIRERLSRLEGKL